VSPLLIEEMAAEEEAMEPLVEGACFISVEEGTALADAELDSLTLEAEADPALLVVRGLEGEESEFRREAFGERGPSFPEDELDRR